MRECSPWGCLRLSTYSHLSECLCVFVVCVSCCSVSGACARVVRCVRRAFMTRFVVRCDVSQCVCVCVCGCASCCTMREAQLGHRRRSSLEPESYQSRRRVTLTAAIGSCAVMSGRAVVRRVVRCCRAASVSRVSAPRCRWRARATADTSPASQRRRAATIWSVDSAFRCVCV